METIMRGYCVLRPFVELLNNKEVNELKELGKMTVYIGTFIIAMVGYITTLIIADFITDMVSGIVIYPKRWGLGKFALIDYLTPPRITWLVYAVGWFLVCILVHYRSKKWIEGDEKVSILSPFFVTLWFFASLAIVFGFIIKTFLVATIYWESLLDVPFAALFWALAPTTAALLGVNNEVYIKD
jgi:hypothetical protein